MRVRSLLAAGALTLGTLGTPALTVPAWAKPPGHDVAPVYQTTVPGESVEADRVDQPVAPGIVRTTFDTFGRSGWTRVHVLNADLSDTSVSADLVAGKVSETRPLKQAADAQHAVAAVNGDFFDITETNSPIGPEIQGGTLVKGTNRPSTVAGVGTDGVAGLADLAIKGTVTVAGTERPLAALNSASVPADGIDAFTPQWGPGLRTLIQDAGPYTEIVAQGGKVTAVNDHITTTPVPDGGLILLGRGAAAAQLATARPGDAAAVAFQPQTGAGSPLRMALGSNDVLVRDGKAVDFPPSTGNDAPKPRTAIGWLNGGHRLLLVTVDGSATFSPGLSYDDMAKLMARLGATEAFMLDGGGSSEIVARRPGDAGVSVVNTPSDGGERPIPNGVGLFSRKGSGTLQGLDVRPRADRVFPGLTRDVTAAGYDETYAAVPIGKHPVGWQAVPGRLGKVSGGVFHATSPGSGSLRVHAGSAAGEHDLRVLGPLHRMSFSQAAVTIDPGKTVSLGLTGHDADGFDAPVAPRDVKLAYDHDAIDVAAEPDGAITISGRPGADGTGTTLTATVGGVTATVPVSVGLIDKSLAEFEPDEHWTATAARATASVSTVDATDRPGAPAGNHALKLDYDFTGQPSTSAGYAVVQPGPLTLPTGASGLALWVKGDGKEHWLRATLRSQGTTNVPFTFATSVDWTGWRRVTGALPTGFADPITLLNVYIVETAQDKKDAGSLEFDALAAQVGQQPGTHEAPTPDPYVLRQGGLQAGHGGGRWTYAVMSDLHVSAAAGPESFAAKQAALALDQAVAARPDFLLVNGDFVDSDSPADFAFASRLLHDHVPAGLPVYWVPGNHEAGLTDTGTLDAFKAATGRPTRQVFDHKGTRFILLDSHTGSLRTSDWDQVPFLQASLREAAKDRKVKDVVVAFHHPPHDPSGAASSQLSDQLEAALVEQWLAAFREDSGKPIALFSGHAHTAAVTRADGVLEVNTPAVGKTPYSSADQGGFFGWMRVGVDPTPERGTAARPSDWLQAESRPLIDGIQLTAPADLAAGSSGPVSATGVTSGFGLTFPLRYPASVTWSGAGGLVVATSPAEAKAAQKRHDVTAVLDLADGTLTAVRPGAVTVTVTSGGQTKSAIVTIDPR